MKAIETLIDLLNNAESFDQKGVILAAYIMSFGPIPKEYGKRVRDALKGEDE